MNLCIRICTAVLFLLVCVSVFCVFSADASAQGKKAKNVIVFIGDGMGFNSDLAGTYYRYGEAGKQSYHKFPVHLGCMTFCQAAKGAAIPADVKGYDPAVFWESIAGGNAKTDFTRTTDSAAAATTLFSGQKTLSGRIGTLPDDSSVKLISEYAAELGKKTGTVTTVQASHATPAGFIAHQKTRGDMDEIFIQMSAKNSILSVVFGGGNPIFHEGKPFTIKEGEKEDARKKRFMAVGGEKTWSELETGKYNGFTVIQKKEDFAALAAGKKPLPKKVIGIPYSNESVPPVDGDLKDVPETAEILKTKYPRVELNQLPTLTEMTLAALNVITSENDKGFVLMVEGGAIDWENHKQDIMKSCWEHTGFSKTIDAVLDYLKKNNMMNETLIIVTADHETGQLWGPNSFTDNNNNGVFDEKEDTFNRLNPIVNKGRGKFPEVQYASKGHSNALVPLWATGPGSELFLKHIKGNDKKAAEFWKFSGDYVDNTDVFYVIKEALGMK
ncbi:MAG: alkaline phosphatase [Planctomycetaceae bacterium]|nr:alkaline phosphatase [Planctomycetaceae bacterium]